MGTKEKAIVGDIKTEFENQKAALDHEISCHNATKSNLEKTTAEYNTEKEKLAETKSMLEKLQTEVEQERTNVSIQREKYDQQLKEINENLRVKENSLSELNEQNNNL